MSSRSQWNSFLPDQPSSATFRYICLITVLKLCNENQMVIEVDLRTNPNHLVEITNDLLKDMTDSYGK